MSDLTQRELHRIIVSSQEDKRDPRYDAVVDLMWGQLRKHVGRFWKLDSELDDVVQDAMVTVTSEKSLTVADPDRFLYWCYQIAANCARQRLRRRVRQYVTDDDTLAAIEDPACRTDDSVARQERLALLKSLCCRLREDPGGEALYLYAIRGWKHDRVASHLGISNESARALVSRARRRLRDDTRLDGWFRDVTDA